MRGRETESGEVVLLGHEEIEGVRPQRSRAIDIEDFVALEDIDPIYFERTYHLAPADDAAARAYALLASVMEQRQRVGIGKVVMREKQYLGAVRPYGKGLALSTMLFADEVVDQSDISDVPSRRPTIKGRERALAEQIVESLESEWKPQRYHDDYEEELRKRIKAKQKGKLETTIEEQPPPARVVDLMEALQASLDRGTARKSTRKSTTKSTRKHSRAPKSASKATKRGASRRPAKRSTRRAS